MNKLHILVTEDQPELASNIGDYLEGKGHTVDYAPNGPLALELALTHHYDLLILDIMLPGMDGLTVCQKIRQQSHRVLPILMLTARDTLEDKLTGFEKGADDYLTKPFELPELEMRCQALSRRHQLQTDMRMLIGDLEVNRKTQTVSRQQKTLALNGMNYRILLILAEAYPRVVTRSELCQKLWGDDPTESDSLRSHIYQLRQAVDKPFDTPLLKTVHGVGFTLDTQAGDQ